MYARQVGLDPLYCIAIFIYDYTTMAIDCTYDSETCAISIWIHVSTNIFHQQLIVSCTLWRSSLMSMHKYTQHYTENIIEICRFKKSATFEAAISNQQQLSLYLWSCWCSLIAQTSGEQIHIKWILQWYSKASAPAMHRGRTLHYKYHLCMCRARLKMMVATLPSWSSVQVADSPFDC